MDAKHLAVPDASFDVVVAQYVITAVPDPEATLDEFIRVLKPGGEIILVNHLGAESGFRRAFEQGFSPIARRLGWSPEFPWARLTRWAEARRRAADRAPADAAARAFLADPVRQDALRNAPRRSRRVARGTGSPCVQLSVRMDGGPDAIAGAQWPQLCLRCAASYRRRRRTPIAGRPKGCAPGERLQTRRQGADVPRRGEPLSDKLAQSRRRDVPAERRSGDQGADARRPATGCR